MNPRSQIRKTIGVVLGTAVLLSASACGFVTGDQKPSAGTAAGDCGTRTLRLATIRAESDPTTIAANDFAARVTKATDGKVTVKVFPNSQLGTPGDIFAAMTSGQNVDMFYEGISIYPTLKGASAFTVTSVPFLWENYDQLLKVMKSPRFQKLIEEAAKSTGVRAITTNGDAEPRALSANRPIKTAADMAGLKLRIAEAPMPQAFAKALGAKPQVVAFADLYLGLRQGVVDAQENGAITMVNQSLFEVQKYYMPTDYIRDVRTWYVGDKLWQSLCSQQRDAITKAANESGEICTAEVRKQVAEAMATLKTKLTIVEPDKDTFKRALDGAFTQFDGKMWPTGLLAEIEQLKQGS